jgi:hypothetical protein
MRKIHEAAVMHIEHNIISQPSIDIYPLRYPILKRKREIIRERKQREGSHHKQDRRGTEDRERGGM